MFDMKIALHLFDIQSVTLMPPNTAKLCALLFFLFFFFGLLAGDFLSHSTCFVVFVRFFFFGRQAGDLLPYSAYVFPIRAGRFRLQQRRRLVGVG